MITVSLKLILLLAILLILSVNISYFHTKNTSYATKTQGFSIQSVARSHLKRNQSIPIPAFIPFRSTFVTSRKYSLAACRIQKNLSTILLNLFCFLNTPRKFNRKASSLTTEFKNYLSSETCNETHASHIADDQTFATKLAIIRDPVERFLSAFVDKCIHEARGKKQRCYGCDRDIICVLQKQYDRFQLIADGKLTNFSYEDRHFAPMSWFCDFNSDNIKSYRILYFGKTKEDQEGTVDELMHVLEESGVSNSTVAYISQELTANRTKHSTSGSMIRMKVEQEMRNSKEVMEWIRRIYVNDYKVFNLDSPFSPKNHS